MLRMTLIVVATCQGGCRAPRIGGFPPRRSRGKALCQNGEGEMGADVLDGVNRRGDLFAPVLRPNRPLAA
jgi:hypothetical protein